MHTTAIIITHYCRHLELYVSSSKEEALLLLGLDFHPAPAVQYRSEHTLLRISSEIISFFVAVNSEFILSFFSSFDEFDWALDLHIQT